MNDFKYVFLQEMIKKYDGHPRFLGLNDKDRSIMIMSLLHKQDVAYTQENIKAYKHDKLKRICTQVPIYNSIQYTLKRKLLEREIAKMGGDLF